MNRRIRNRLQLLSASLAAIGGAAALTRSKRAAEPPPTNHLGGVQRRVQLFGHELFVTELGAGAPLLLIHGVYAGASSYEYRYIAPLLASSHRVIAFDFLGCGLSDHPDIEYSAEVFIRQIVHIVSSVIGEPTALVGSSYGAAYAIRAAADLGTNVTSVTAISPAGATQNNDSQPAWRSIAETALRLPLIGNAAYGLLTSDASVRAYLRRVYSDERMITPELLQHYASVSHIAGAKLVTAAFVGGMLACDLTPHLPFLETPISIIRGSGPHIGPEDGDTIAALGNNVSCKTFEGCGALVHEERPHAACEAILAAAAAKGSQD